MDINYADYKAVITIKDKDGDTFGEFITYREDIINDIINATCTSTIMTKGQEMVIVIKPAERINNSPPTWHLSENKEAL